MSGSRAWVQDITGKPCVVFCFPGGQFDRRQLPLLRECGFVAAGTVEMMSLAGAQPMNGLALLPDDEIGASPFVVHVRWKCIEAVACQKCVARADSSQERLGQHSDRLDELREERGRRVSPLGNERLLEAKGGRSNLRIWSACVTGSVFIVVRAVAI
jgi:hypothetical protein